MLTDRVRDTSQPRCLSEVRAPATHRSPFALKLLNPVVSVTQRADQPAVSFKPSKLWNPNSERASARVCQCPRPSKVFEPPQAIGGLAEVAVCYRNYTVASARVPTADPTAWTPSSQAERHLKSFWRKVTFQQWFIFPRLPAACFSFTLPLIY